jgi:methionyl-tRNA synthetase
MSKFYITTSIPYANGDPHIGFAMELIQADVLARYHRLIGDGVYFLTGIDQNGLKNHQTAQQQNIPTLEFVEQRAAKFQELAASANVSNDDFIKTTDQQRHWPASQALWQKLVDNDDIYLKKYKGLYSIRAERFVTQKELDEDQGREHSKVEEIEEENYFFALSKYQDRLHQLIQSDELKIVPDSKKQEMLSFIDQGLEDISFSRSATTLPWGVPVPNDPSQVMYVWCDALTNYISALGYNGTTNSDLMTTFWPADVHLIGKDIVRFHALFWPAMLMSANLPLPKNIYVHGFINVEGQKMSKSLGNVISPFDLFSTYGIDSVRYFLLREIPSTGDGDYSESRFKDRFNDDLANGLGNLVARVAKVCQKSELSFNASSQDLSEHPQYHQAISAFQLSVALEYIWTLIRNADQYIDTTKPWTLPINELEPILTKLTADIVTIATLLEPFMPATSAKIIAQYTDTNIQPSAPLFPRLS